MDSQMYGSKRYTCIIQVTLARLNVFLLKLLLPLLLLQVTRALFPSMQEMARKYSHLS
jgi:hypothetical protein